MPNSAIAGGMNVDGRRTLTQGYSQPLGKKGKDPVPSFYPNGNIEKTNL
jgi:hypothetical protein